MKKQKTVRRKQLNNRRGDAMILVLCIMMVFMVLSLSVLLASAVLLGTAKKNAVSERCRTASSDFSFMLKEQLSANRQNVPVRLQQFFMDMVQTKMQEGNTDFFIDEEAELTDEEEADFIHRITISNDGKEIGEVLNGYEIYLEAEWIGSKEQIGQALNQWEAEQDALDMERKPKETCYSGITLKLTTVCETEKRRESYRTTVYYTVWIDGTMDKGTGAWKFVSGKEVAQ